MVDCVDEERETEDVGEKDEFLYANISIAQMKSKGHINIERLKWSQGKCKHTCLTSLLICPTFTRKFKAAIHSFVLNRVSRAKSWRCVTSRSMT
jgi:hypothetical protein